MELKLCNLRATYLTGKATQTEKLKLLLSGSLAVDNTKTCTIMNKVKNKAYHQLWCLGPMGTMNIFLHPDTVTDTNIIQEQRAQKIVKGWGTWTLESTDSENNQRSMKGWYHDEITMNISCQCDIVVKRSNVILWVQFRLKRLKITGIAKLWSAFHGQEAARLL